MWLRSPAAENDKCPWNEQMSYACAKGVHLAILKWASEHGCPWGADVAMLAAAGAHLEEVLKYGWKQGVWLSVWCLNEESVALAYARYSIWCS